MDTLSNQDIRIGSDLFSFADYLSEGYEPPDQFLVIYCSKDNTKPISLQYTYQCVKYFDKASDFYSFNLENASKLQGGHLLILIRTPENKEDGLQWEKELREYLGLATL